jgi:hypothetical protein
MSCTSTREKTLEDTIPRETTNTFLWNIQRISSTIVLCTTCCVERRLPCIRQTF